MLQTIQDLESEISRLNSYKSDINAILQSDDDFSKDFLVKWCGEMVEFINNEKKIGAKILTKNEKWNLIKNISENISLRNVTEVGRLYNINSDMLTRCCEEMNDDIRMQFGKCIIGKASQDEIENVMNWLSRKTGLNFSEQQKELLKNNVEFKYIMQFYSTRYKSRGISRKIPNISLYSKLVESYIDGVKMYSEQNQKSYNEIFELEFSENRRRYSKLATHAEEEQNEKDLAITNKLIEKPSIWMAYIDGSVRNDAELLDGFPTILKLDAVDEIKNSTNKDNCRENLKIVNELMKSLPEKFSYEEKNKIGIELVELAKKDFFIGVLDEKSIENLECIISNYKPEEITTFFVNLKDIDLKDNKQEIINLVYAHKENTEYLAKNFESVDVSVVHAKKENAEYLAAKSKPLFKTKSKGNIFRNLRAKNKKDKIKQKEQANK